MISLLLGFVFMLIFSSFWSSTYILFIFLTVISLVFMQQNFLMSLNWLFLGNQLSMLMVFLSIFLCLLSLVSTPSQKSNRYILCLIMLGFILTMAFSSNNILSFYVFFEASLIPTLMLIICWGYQPERLQAGSYMMLYTVSASLPLLFLILNHSFNMSSLNILVLSNLENPIYSDIFILFLYGAFLVKLPMYSVHLWLPKAHVEAPLAGSMILAGILLKLGGFGLFLMNKCFDLVTKSYVMMILMSLSIWGSFLACLMCLRQTDMKALVAYSSVAHMGLVVVGVLSNQQWGLASAIIMMFAHGVTSSAMFCMTYFTYEKVNTRSMFYLKGLLQLYPILSYFWFIFCCVNMAAPPTLNLISELLIVPCLWNISLYMILVMGLLVFFSACYNMYLYTSLNHGFFSSYCLPAKNMKSFEILSLILHGLPLLLLLKSEFFIMILLEF
uniref:NADH-ubiquinone oxidoreductase chain 4 n=1 Tax=Pseudosuccinea columella TaxID=31228 RepID=A0A4P8Y334_PSECM|nr:NADH dehydrogenase subunit 4 [Pseudosuccinea columella]QCT09602.1 NADH dehydrogenase subunit 4 [Pseudosuccinea columella]